MHNSLGDELSYLDAGLFCHSYPVQVRPVTTLECVFYTRIIWAMIQCLWPATRSYRFYQPPYLLSLKNKYCSKNSIRFKIKSECIPLLLKLSWQRIYKNIDALKNHFLDQRFFDQQKSLYSKMILCANTLKVVVSIFLFYRFEYQRIADER